MSWHQKNGVGYTTEYSQAFTYNFLKEMVVVGLYGGPTDIVYVNLCQWVVHFQPDMITLHSSLSKLQQVDLEMNALQLQSNLNPNGLNTLLLFKPQPGS